MTVIGCSAHGMGDRCLRSDGSTECLEAPPVPAALVFPEGAEGAPLVGAEAVKHRTASGLPWPPDARIEPGEPPRRLPVWLAWRILRDTRDGRPEWPVGGAGRFPVAQAVVAHVKSLAGEKKAEDDRLVVAIPDRLGESGQEELLRGFRRAGMNNVKLLWRPVAATLAWIEAHPHLPETMGHDDAVVALFLGADEFEITPIRLRRKDGFVLPLRQRPGKVRTALAGFDAAVWAAVLAGAPPDDLNAIWRALEGPEVWAALAGRPVASGEMPPRLWVPGGRWAPLFAPESIGLKTWAGEARPASAFRALARKAWKCWEDPTQPDGRTWEALLWDLFKEAVSDIKEPVRAVLPCGPLAGPPALEWLEGAFDDLGWDRRVTRKGGFVWRPQGEDSIARGCLVYGERLRAGLPTYLDTLPRLLCYGEKDGKHEWFPLVPGGEQDGGKPYEDTLKRRFQLRKGTSRLDVYLRWEEESGEIAMRKHSVDFPKAPDSDVAVDAQVQMEPAGGRATVKFIPRDEAWKKSGLRVSLDYSRMEAIEEKDLPTPKLAYPPVLSATIEEKDKNALQGFWWPREVYVFFEINVDDPNYIDVVKDLRTAISGTQRVIDGNRWIRRINHAGLSPLPKGEETITEIARKLEEDLAKLEQLSSGFQSKPACKKRDQICLAGSWLWLKAPKAVVNYFRQGLMPTPLFPSSLRRGTFLEAASRVLGAEEDIGLLGREIMARIRKGNATLHSLKALGNLLEFREMGYRAFGGDEENARRAARAAVGVIEEEARRSNFLHKFYGGIRLLLYILRFRIENPKFLDPTDQEADQLFDTIRETMRKSINYLEQSGRERIADRVSKISQGIEDYRHGMGDVNLIKILTDAMEQTDPENLENGEAG